MRASDTIKVIPATKIIAGTKQVHMTAVDLFAGAGGFSLAAQSIGITVLAAIELNKHACETYRANFIDGHSIPPILIENDITTVSPSDLLGKMGLLPGSLDIIIGGPPCQGYSTHRLKDSGVDDPRNKLLLRYFDFVRVLRPKAFIIENVAGLLWSRHAYYLNTLLQLIDAAGYDTYGPDLLNARDYGVPQNRKRVFIIGMRKDIAAHLEWPPCITHFPPNSRAVRDAGKPCWVTSSMVFTDPAPENDPNNIHMNHSPQLIQVFESTPKNGGSRAQSERTLHCHEAHDGHTDVYGRIDPAKPGPTMTTACINPSKGRFVHPTENHGITVRHAARFQTFPDCFIFKGGLIASGVQIGNAVPILLGMVVLQKVVDALIEAQLRNDRK